MRSDKLADNHTNSEKSDHYKLPVTQKVKVVVQE